MMELATKEILPGIVAHFRPGSSDERVLHEVLVKRVYRRPTLKFDVEAGERWLDLGANIGAFALYCQSRKAIATCYEPDPECFEILSLNVPQCEKHRMAVTNQFPSSLPFWSGRTPGDFYRSTAYPTKGLPPHAAGELPNVHGLFLKDQVFDGVKMDIEGSEGGLLDDGLLPKCHKLCLEYHTSRDASAAHLKARLDYLKSQFQFVAYSPEYQTQIDSGNEKVKTFRDRMIYCMGWKDMLSSVETKVQLSRWPN